MKEHRVFAALYDRISRPLEQAALQEHRSRLLADLVGDVLDIGAGTGVNLPHFLRATRIVAAEPDAAMRRRLAHKLGQAGVPVEISDAAAESLPFAAASFDAVVCTCVLCTVLDLDRALAEAFRVLKPGGRLVALEHVRGMGTHARLQDLVTPLWSRFSAGCHPNRDTRAAIERAGFVYERVETFELEPRWIPSNPWLIAVAVRPEDT